MNLITKQQESGLNLVQLVNTFWKLKLKISKLDISDKQIKPLNTYINTIFDIITSAGYNIIDYTDKKYNFGDNIDILSVEGEGEECRIVECLQPTIIHENRMIQKATVIIKRG